VSGDLVLLLVGRGGGCWASVAGEVLSEGLELSPERGAVEESHRHLETRLAGVWMRVLS
jgi:hypothetical protein